MSANTNAITWHAVGDELPDSDITVLLFNAAWTDPVWPGFLDEDGWRAYDGLLLDGSGEGAGDLTPPTHWADMPAGPEVLP